MVLHGVHVVGRHHGGAVLGLRVAVQRHRRTLAQVGGDGQVPGHVRIVVRVVVVTAVTAVTAGVTRVTADGVDPVQRILAHVGRRHPLLLLTPIAEPHADDLLLQLEAVRQVGDLLGRGLGILVEVLLQGPLDGHLDARALLPLPALRRDLVDRGRGPRRRVGLRQPLLEQGHQLAHVFKAELQRLEPADGRLGEDVAVEGPQGQAHVGLREPQLDPALLELFREGFQVI